MMKYFFFFLAPVVLFAIELNVDKSAANSVKFISDAPLEAFEGVTDNIDGYVAWDGDNMIDSSEFYFEVDLNSLDTGIGLRNRHMRENYLETDTFRFASYSGKIIKVDNDTSGAILAESMGIFKLHGIEKKMTIPVTVHNVGSLYLVEAQFIILLSDFNIKVPQLMFMKVDEKMDVRLKMTLKTVEQTF